MKRTIPEPPAIARRTRPPPHWKFAVSVRKRWHRLRRLWRPEREIEEIDYFGATFHISPNDLIGREMVLKRFEWLQLTAMLTACHELNPAAFIDVGANFGLYTAIIGRQQQGTQLIALEPNRSVLEWLRGHIALNGWKTLSSTKARRVLPGKRLRCCRASQDSARYQRSCRRIKTRLRSTLFR